jgi:hypothetical protein
MGNLTGERSCGGNEFSEARARLGFDSCLECGKNEAAAEIARRARMIAPISHKSGYTYLGPDEKTQRQRLLEGSAKTPRMETFTRRAAAYNRFSPYRHILNGPGKSVTGR